MGKKVKLRRVASSLVVTIPKDIAEALNWKEGDAIEITVTGPKAIQLSKA